MQTDFPIFGDYNKKEEKVFDSQDLVNLFIIKSNSGKKKFSFLNMPGLKKAVDVETGREPTRLLFTFGEYMFGVFGASVYRFLGDLYPVFVGSLGTSRGYVSYSINNNNQVIFVDGQGGYLYNIDTAVFSKITSSGFPAKPLNVVVLDGYFVIPLGESRTFQISGLNSGTAWDILDEAQISAYSGYNVGVGVVNRRLYFFKTDSTEVWFNNGSADFPFRRDNNLLFNFGCLATQSIVSGFGMLFWLARDSDGVGSVMMTTGQEPQRVSNDSVDSLIATFTNPSDMSAYLYKENSGHIFLVMSWTKDDVTLVYDATMGTWQRMEMQQKERVQGDPYSGKIRHLSNCHVYFNGVHYVGSYKSPTIYKMSRDYATNDGEPIVRRCVSKHFFDPNDYHMLQINHIQYDMQMGLGESGSGTGVYSNSDDDPLINPQAFLSLSKDNGPFGDESSAPIGKIGNTRARAIFRKKGQARDVVSQFSIYAAVAPIAILGASIDYEVLSK